MLWRGGAERRGVSLMDDLRLVGEIPEQWTVCAAPGGGTPAYTRSHAVLLKR